MAGPPADAAWPGCRRWRGWRWRDRDFALLTAGFFACGFQLAFLTMHLPCHLDLCGLPAELGAMALMTVGLFNIPGSWLCGRVSNHIRPERGAGLDLPAAQRRHRLLRLAPPT